MKYKMPWWLSGTLIGILIIFTISIFGGDRPFGGLLYTVYFDFFQNIVGYDRGHTSLVELSGEYGLYSVLAFGVLCIIISIKISLIELEDEEENMMLNKKRK